MPDMNYVVVTAAECPVEKRAMAVEKMSGFADDLKSQAGCSCPNSQRAGGFLSDHEARIYRLPDVVAMTKQFVRGSL